MGNGSRPPTAGSAEARAPVVPTVRAGTVGRPHGLDGAFHVRQARVGLLARSTVVIDGCEHDVVGRAGTDAAPILRLAAVGDRAAATALNGAEVSVPREAMPALGEDEWYADELVGCRVHDGDLQLGTVAALVALPSCEVLEVTRPSGGELLVPLVTDAVLEVDVPSRRIEVSAAFLGEG